MSVPKELNYNQVKPISAGGTPDILRFRSMNSTYSATDTVRIEIPCGRTGMHLFPHNTYLEATLNLTVTSVAADAANTAVNAYIDQSVYSLFRRMRLIHGSNTVEDTLYCNRLWNGIYDVQKNQYERNGDSINLLVNEDESTYGYRFTYNKVAAAGTADTTTFTVNFCFVLPSGLIGSLAQKALPLSLMGASSLYLELELDQNNVSFVCDATVSALSYTLSNIYLNCKVVKVPSDIENLLIESTGGRIVLLATSYRGEMKTIATGSGSFNDKFAFQLSSFKNFVYFYTPQASANGTLTTEGITGRPFCSLSEWYLTLNGVQYPPQSIQGYAKCYMELLRAYDMMNDTNAGGILILTNYSTGDGTVNPYNSEFKFITALDLDRFNHSSDILVSGTNTIGANVNLVIKFSTATATALNLYAYVMYDVIYNLQNGLLTVEM